MAEPSRRRRRWIVGVSILVIIVTTATVVSIYLNDSGADAVVRQLRPGLTDAEVRRILADVFYVDDFPSSTGRGYLFRGHSEDVFVKMEGDRVAAVERWPDQGPFWERTRRNLESTRRNWEQRRRNWEQKRRETNRVNESIGGQ